MAKSKLPFAPGTLVRMHGYRGTYVVKACPPGREHYDFFASCVDELGRERGFPAVAQGAEALIHGPVMP